MGVTKIMQQFVEFMLGSFAALFPIVDPVGGVPIFLLLTADYSKQLQHHVAGRVALYAVVVLVLFLLVGGGILRFFGISLEVVRIAGGIVVFHSAWQTMNSQPRLTGRDNQAAVARCHKQEDISFMPMTIPMLAGPGSIAVTLGLAAQAGYGLSIRTGLNLLAASLAIALMGGVIYLCLRSSSLLLVWLGETGIRATSRTLGLFILAVGVQLILNGVADWLKHLGLVRGGA